jgi:CheY-like chemotaxis protein
VEEILKAGTRAKDLLGQILNFTRQSEQSRVRVDSNSAIHQAVKSVRGQIPEAIEIQENLSSEEIRLKADPGQLHQVMISLLKNAADAIGNDPGSILIESRLVRTEKEEEPFPAELPPGDYLRVRIADDGCGMDVETRQKIFDPYFSTKERGVGTGMSLAAVQGIVKGHDGTITVSSEPGKGSNFDVFLPYQTAVDSAKAPKSETGLRQGSERILVIDDEPPLVAILERMLGHLGYKVSSTTRAEKALEMFSADPNAFDLVVTDLAMPGMPGDKLAEKMMAIRPDIRVVIWTAFSEGVDHEKMKAQGIKDCLDKPVIMSDLADTVRRVLDE